MPRNLLDTIPRRWRHDLSLPALVAGCVLATSPARAQEGCPPDHVGCHTVDVDFEHREALFDDVMLDSGWVPSGSPLQVRFAVFLGGSTEVDLGGRAVTSWPSALDVRVPGRPGTGRLAINYGLEIVAMIRIDVEVAGVRYRWTGDIPIPGGIPRDLRLFDEVTFDPFVLPPSEPRPVVAWDDTDVVRLLDVDLTDALIPIPGIGGGFQVDAVGSLESRYRTDRIEVLDAVGDITEEGGSVVVRADPGATELGGAKDYTVLPHGTIGYEGVVTAIPALYVQIAGRRFELTLAEVPLRVASLDRATRFAPADVHVPLPDIRVEPTMLALGEVEVGGTVERLVTVANDGEAPLEVAVSMPRAPFSTSASALTIPPRSSARLAVRFDPTAGGDDNTVLVLSSNDPDEPLVTIRVGGRGSEPPLPTQDGGVTDAGGGGGSIAGGCGCHAPAGAATPGPGALVLLAVAAAWARRRARKSHKR